MLALPVPPGGSIVGTSRLQSDVCPFVRVHSDRLYSIPQAGRPDPVQMPCIEPSGVPSTSIENALEIPCIARSWRIVGRAHESQARGNSYKSSQVTIYETMTFGAKSPI